MNHLNQIFIPVILYTFLLFSGTDDRSIEEVTYKTKTMTEYATLGGGCFWCTEAVFSEIKGVRSVMPGYSGGKTINPSYEDVCTGLTGHAEVIQIAFDPEVISYKELLEVFFSTHDPTTLNRQGADSGTQYRSVIFYHSENQKQIAEQMIAELNSEKIRSSPVITQVIPFKTFYPAEDYHVNYYSRNPYAGYCQMVIRPKINKLEKSFGDKLKQGLHPEEVQE